ncbi:MAG: zinc ribbon domain-containing protein [Clostridiales bacterium]|nr:zinc ribbon domain-containing protein [Clostridiales bacterium]
MFCKNCGAEIDDRAVVCPKCGVAQGKTAQAAADDAPNVGFAVLCFFIPVVGLILYLMWHETYPLKAKSCGKGALIGVILEVVGGILLGVLYSCVIAGAVSSYPYY